ncbi:MAG: hypothetical protein HRT44_07255 [Bdellovibrionales bacterium]|nr:hypothetical protein [Bdellovibrionales bacterium]NQZ19034.1 hypothetical protein [Bdellovibrionales bacterium]
MKFVHTDRSVNRIQETQAVFADSLISFTTSDHESFVVESNTECYGDDLEETISSERLWTDKNDFRVYQLLPLEVFKPSEEPTTIVCDFSLTVINDIGSRNDVLLERISIINAADYSDSKFLPHTSKEESLYLLNHLVSQNLEFPWDKGQAHLMCEQSSHTFVINNGQFEWKKVEEYKPLVQDISLCRLIFENTSKDQRKFSRLFQIQRNPARVHAEIINNLPKTRHFQNSYVSVDLGTDSFVAIKLTNIGRVTAYVDFDSFRDSSIEITSLHSSKQSAVIGSTYEFEFQWRLSDGEILKQNGRDYIEIPVGEEIYVEAHSRGRLVCSSGIHGNLDSNICPQTHLYHGYFASLKNLPAVMVNASTSFHNMDMYNNFLDLNHFQFNGLEFNYWKGTPLKPEACGPSFSKESARPAEINKIIEGGHQHRCRVE